MPTPEIEQEGSIVVPAAPGTEGHALTFEQKSIAIIGGFFGTMIMTLIAIALNRRRKDEGVEATSWQTLSATIDRLTAQLNARDQENEVLRTQRNDFQAAATEAATHAKIASDAADTARKSADASVARNAELEQKWLKARRYIYDLQKYLADHGLDVPPEPVE